MESLLESPLSLTLEEASQHVRCLMPQHCCMERDIQAPKPQASLSGQHLQLRWGSPGLPAPWSLHFSVASAGNDSDLKSVSR